MDQNPLYEVEYNILEGGEDYSKTYQYCYTMGDRILASGEREALGQQREAKLSAAKKTVTRLRDEGHVLW